MLDEILDLFNRHKRGPEANRSQPSRGIFDAFGEGDDDEDRRHPQDDERRGDSRRDRGDRREIGEDWD
jgi:hypothetical protein